MSLTQKATLSASIAGQCLVAAFAAAGPASAAQIPEYFFREWTVTKNCTEAHAGLAAQVAAGLRFRISRDSAAADGSYRFQAEDGAQQQWAANWNGLRLEYRPGTQMTSVPADFECIPGQESSSPFLAMSGYAQASEPYYEQQHWYGLATIHGQLEHVLIFPRNMKGASSAIIVLASVTAPSTIQLDDDGVIHSSD
ncbi:MAG TPA: hypothetical protein VFB37_17070 [Steroidobacteraceae bacterium]|nr:hypothetical protein [Steroidobacteraceae bacterium]